MTKKKADLAQALLDAHVAHAIERLTGEGFEAALATELDALLADAARLRLKDVISAKTIKDTAKTYAADIELGAGLPELVAEVARAVYAHPIYERTALKDVMRQERYLEFVDKLLELKVLRERLVHEVATSPIYIAFASDLLYHGIKGYLAKSGELTRSIPGAGSMMKLGRSVLNKASPGLENSLDEGLRTYVSRSVEATASTSADFVLKHLGDDALRGMARDIWDRVKFTPIASLREEVSGDDIEDLFVIGYEFWRELRKTKVYTAVIDAGIDTFYERYGSATLAELLDELGISRDIMLAEAMRHAPPVLRVLKRKKMLDGFLRRHLADFYQSPEVARLLADAS